MIETAEMSLSSLEKTSMQNAEYAFYSKISAKKL